MEKTVRGRSTAIRFLLIRAGKLHVDEPKQTTELKHRSVNAITALHALEMLL